MSFSIYGVQRLNRPKVIYYGVHIKKLQGELSKMYRYRVGDIRILYEIHEDIKIVRIKVIEGRGKAYR